MFLTKKSVIFFCVNRINTVHSSGTRRFRTTVKSKKGTSGAEASSFDISVFDGSILKSYPVSSALYICCGRRFSD